MGCGTSKVGPPKVFRSERGVNPTRLLGKAAQAVQETVYLFGGSQLLQLEVASRRVAPVVPQPTAPLARRCSSLLVRETGKIVVLGGELQGHLVKTAYMFSPPDFAVYEKLPDFPVPVVGASLAHCDGVLFAVGGMTSSAEDEGLLYRAFALKLREKAEGQWSYFCDLPLHRRSANLIVSNKKIYILGGYSIQTRSTQVDSINTVSRQAAKEPYRLAMGVEGARMALHGQNILFVGGQRTGNQPDRLVFQMNFRKKGVLSCR
jgi:N-acetylneuraminic acid mutarotase